MRRLLPLALRSCSPCSAAAAAADLPLRAKGDRSPLGNRAAVERDDAHALGAHQPARRDPLEAVEAEQGRRHAALEHRGRPARGLRRARVAASTTDERGLDPDPHPRPAERPHGLGPRGAALQPRGRSRRSSRSTGRSCARRCARSGKTIWSSPVGVGAPGTVTPKGRFWIRERLRNLDGSPIYGPWAFGTSAYSTADGLARRRRRRHPRHEPARAHPRPPVARLRARAERPGSAALAKLMPVGTPLRIRLRQPQYGGKSAYQSPSLRNAVQNARLADSSSSASSMFGV